jgi:hypothetical protein
MMLTKIDRVTQTALDTIMIFVMSNMCTRQ